jgi:hypothetical protein
VSDWKELPRPAFAEDHLAVYDARVDPFIVHTYPADALAEVLVALPEYVAEVERLRAWVEELASTHSANTIDRIRAGEWPDGRKA